MLRYFATTLIVSSTSSLKGIFMSLVQDLTPLNLQEEKEKFFAKNCQYNPQFKYKKLITVNKLLKYGTPKPEYLKIAKKILDKAFDGRTEEDIQKLEGTKITKDQALNMLDDFLQKNKLKDQLKIKWIKNHISKASIYKNSLKLREQFDFRQGQFASMLYHEIGTHFLRRLNHLQQPFYKKKKKMGFNEYLPTEEGLASLHSLLASNFKLDYYHALTYKATQVALNNSFVNTFNFVNKYLDNKKRAWRLTVKFKRGLYDTSQEGAFTKSIVYLEGINLVYQYLQQTNFDINGLYFGKIACQDVDKAKELNPDYQPQLPHFIVTDKKTYIQNITKICQINFLKIK